MPATTTNPTDGMTWELREAYDRGFADGFANPQELPSGITWGDERDNAYDHGVNVGQSTARYRGA